MMISRPMLNVRSKLPGNSSYSLIANKFMNKHFRKPEIETDSTLSIMGEPFVLGNLGGKTVLTHRHWSLTGTGCTQAEACASLREEAEEIADFYLSKPDESLTVEAVALKQFLQIKRD
jgi:hypothetical protein